jgi:hypothetical protein
LSQADWSAVDSLIKAAEPSLIEDSMALRDLLERSRDQPKFTDPLLCDLGLHRWLAKDREESYSDWLAWTLEQLGDADAILRVLGVQDAEFQSLCSGRTFRLEREAFVQEGAPDREGKIDLLIHFGQPVKALLGVEVKTTDESYNKQAGYLRSLKGCCGCVKCVLLAIPDVPPDSCFGFTLRRWQEVSLALRREIVRYVGAHPAETIAAMMCGFVAAVEQNLLEFGTAAARRACSTPPKPTWLSGPLRKYLRRALGEVNI